MRDTSLAKSRVWASKIETESSETRLTIDFQIKCLESIVDIQKPIIEVNIWKII